jgi:hypothetical protein
VNVHQRFAATPDRPFLWELHCATMRDAIERTWGWDERWQRADFDRRFDESAVTMLGLDGTAAGCLWLESRPGAIYVSDIQVLPRFQRKAHLEQWQALLFRDHLRADADAARDYEPLKRRLAEDYPDDRVAYTKAKTGFVTRII